MGQRDRKDILAALKSKGFIERPSGDDHDRFDFLVDGKKVGIFTKISRGSKYKVYDDYLLGRMSRQLELTKSELLDLINCPITQDRYIRILREKGRIE